MLYSKEELVAEMCSAFLCGATGIDMSTVVPQAAAYIAGWSAKFKDDPKVLVTAAGLAQRAADFVQGITPADWADTNTEEPATV